MRVVRDDLWLCVDCLMYAVNGDLSDIDIDDRVKEVEEGVGALGDHLLPDFDIEKGEGHESFARKTCDGCGDTHAGEWHRFAVLGESGPDVECINCGEMFFSGEGHAEMALCKSCWKH